MKERPSSFILFPVFILHPSSFILYESLLMNASELLKAGRLTDAIQAQLQAVKSDPANESKRWFLFDLLAFNGDTERAIRQITALQPSTPEDLGTWQAYRQLLDAEVARRKLFSDGQHPQFFGEAPPSIALRIQAIDHLRGGRTAEAAKLLDQANREFPLLEGTLNGKEFKGLRNADDVLGGVLEVFARGQYFWVPLEHIKKLTLGAPESTRDLLWMRARLELAEATGDVYVPTTYPNSHLAGDENLRLGRGSDWIQHPQGPTVGVGQHVFLVGDSEPSITEWRELVIK